MGLQKSRYKEPLHEKDTLTTTYGCRHAQPSICGNNSVPGKCAFTREDNMCCVPPNSWKKLYEKLIASKSIV
jgi:hypothetical protein